MAMVMENVSCITQQGAGMGEDGWDGLPTQYTVRGLKDPVIDAVLL